MVSSWSVTRHPRTGWYGCALQRIVSFLSMAKVVNLNRFRKQKAREQAAVLAAGNREKFGRSKAQKALQSAQDEEARRRLDALRRETPANSEEP